MEYILIVLFAYLAGSSNMAFYIAKAKKVDMRRNGSGNLGTSNAVITMGWAPGIAVGIHDIGKGVAAVLAAKLLFPDAELAGVVAGVSCVLGHIFPFYLKFKGGKGFATYLGMLFALSWKIALVVVLLVAVITLVTDYLSLGTFATITVAPVCLGVAAHSWILPLILLIATAVIFFKHRENITRLRNGTEIGLRSAAKGEHRVEQER